MGLLSELPLGTELDASAGAPHRAHQPRQGTPRGHQYLHPGRMTLNELTPSGHSARDTCNMHQPDYSSQQPLKSLPPRPPSTEVTLVLAEAHVPNQWSVPGVESGQGWPRILGRGEPGAGVAARYGSQGSHAAWPPGAPGLPPVAHQPA